MQESVGFVEPVETKHQSPLERLRTRVLHWLVTVTDPNPDSRTAMGIANELSQRIRSPRVITVLVAAAAGVAVCLSLVFPREVAIACVVTLGISVSAYLFADPERTFLAMVFCFPILGIGRIEIGVTVTLSKLLAALLILQLILIRVQERHRIRFPWSPHDRYLVAFWIYALVLSLGALVTIDRVAPSGGFNLRGPYLRFVSQLLVLLLMAGVYFGTRIVVRDRRTLRLTLKTLIASFVSLSIYGLYQFVGYRFGWPFTDIRQGTTAYSRVGRFLNMTRISSVAGEPKNLALTMLPLIILLLSLRASRVSLWGRERTSLIIIVLLLAVFLGTFSRAGFILLPLCLLALPLLRGQKGTGRIWATVAFCVVLLVAGGHVGTRVLGISLYDMFTVRISETALEQFQATNEFPKLVGAWRTIASSPIVGVGLGNATFYMKRVMAEMGWTETLPVENPPNQFLALWAETGLIGLALFLAFVIGGLLHIRRRVGAMMESEEKQIALGLFAAASAMVAVHVYLTWLSEPFLWFWLGLAAAAVDLSRRREYGAAPNEPARLRPPGASRP